MSNDTLNDRVRLVVSHAKEISRLMDQIAAIAITDAQISDLICHEFPFRACLYDVACEVDAWREEMIRRAPTLTLALPVVL